MIQFIIEVIAFQLVFMVVYDFFLKQETFFQWNRAYLLTTFVLSLILPWIKLEMFRESLPQEYLIYPEFLWGLDNAIELKGSEGTPWFSGVSWEYTLLFSGMFFAALIFGFKLLRIQQLRLQGDIEYFPKFTRIIIANSSLAFSFFRSIFLGDKVMEKEHENIIQHELVHIEQRHSLDLIFFEIMRIVGWFNPLVYVYQSRISDLHEYIADARVAKTHKKEQYQFLLSQVFQTENISFVNQFFKSSLIKKRIVMLQKSKSKKIWRLKYLFLVPVIMGMLIYSSCQADQKFGGNNAVLVGNVEDLTPEEEDKILGLLKEFSSSSEDWQLIVKDAKTTMKYIKSDDDSYITGPEGEKIRAKLVIDSERDRDGEADVAAFMEKMKETSTVISEAKAEWRDQLTYDILANDKLTDSEKRKLIEGISKLASDDFNVKSTKNPDAKNGTDYIVEATKNTIPFALVEEVPVFPGCESEGDKRDCFIEKMMRHIQKHFNYPQEARDAGIEGRVNLLFTIDKNGFISNIKKRGPHELLEAEAERIIKRLPRMQAGIHKGEKVNVPFSIPLTFKL
ncbi:MAG: TonB family protein [Flavobacteriaceae bacterium]